jgi:hypothetical protein
MAISENDARSRAPVPVIGLLMLAAAGLVAGCATLARLLPKVLASPTAPWVLARAGGLAAYLLLVALVIVGLVLSHPSARRLRWPTVAARVALHVALAVFTLAFTLIHVVALVVDPWADVGAWGALLPLASSYRPVAVTLGVLAVWAGVLTGFTAALAGRRVGRVWWPLHKVALLVLVLAWLHGMLAGSDARQLRPVYLWTALAVASTALARYLGSTPGDLARSRAREGYDVAGWDEP